MDKDCKGEDDKNEDDKNEDDKIIKQILSTCKKINKLDDNIYFHKLKKFELDENSKYRILNNEGFVRSQEGFISAIDNWSKLLAQLLIKVPGAKERLVIVENLYDEHGEGDINESHTSTFQRFMKSLGCTRSLIVNDNPLEYKSSSPIRKFNKKLEEVFKNNDWIYCSAVLGMIEYTYIIASKNIHQYTSNYLKSNDISHYSLHEIIDIKHSTDIFSILKQYYGISDKLYGPSDNKLINEEEKLLEKDNSIFNREKIDRGILKGYTLLNDLYSDLSKYM